MSQPKKNKAKPKQDQPAKPTAQKTAVAELAKPAAAISAAEDAEDSVASFEEEEDQQAPVDTSSEIQDVRNKVTELYSKVDAILALLKDQQPNKKKKGRSLPPAPNSINTTSSSQSAPSKAAAMMAEDKEKDSSSFSSTSSSSSHHSGNGDNEDDKAKKARKKKECKALDKKQERLHKHTQIVVGQMIPLTQVQLKTAPTAWDSLEQHIKIHSSLVPTPQARLLVWIKYFTLPNHCTTIKNWWGSLNRIPPFDGSGTAKTVTEEHLAHLHDLFLLATQPEQNQITAIWDFLFNTPIPDNVLAEPGNFNTYALKFQQQGVDYNRRMHNTSNLANKQLDFCWYMCLTRNPNVWDVIKYRFPAVKPEHGIACNAENNTVIVEALTQHLSTTKRNGAATMPPGVKGNSTNGPNGDSSDRPKAGSNQSGTRHKNGASNPGQHQNSVSKEGSNGANRREVHTPYAPDAHCSNCKRRGHWIYECRRLTPQEREKAKEIHKASSPVTTSTPKNS